MAVPTAEQLNVRLAVSYGSTLGSERPLLDYTEPDATEVTQGNVISKELAAGATDQTVDLSTYVDTLHAITIEDRSNIGLKVGLAAGGTKFRIAANGAMCIRWNSSVAPPTLYLDNESGASKCFLQIGIAGSSS